MPQEIEVLYILPAIRRGFSSALKELGLSQKEIAGLLHVTEAAVSQYLSSKRANRVIFDSKILAEIRRAAKKIAKGEQPFLRESQRITQLALSRGITCNAHIKYGCAPEGCDVCFAGHPSRREVELNFARKARA